MIFEELVLHNFGIYQGRHSVDLKPKAPQKPIILFGALNGGGKTTFLDALQLALYGKFANCSNRGNLSYPDYLKRTINNHVDPKKGAALELQFRHVREGKEETYRVIRSWWSTGKGIKESLEVLRDGRLDPVITDRWYEYVEEFIPAQVSSLFFFDGEKIEALADQERSAELLRTGIHALLGLDLVDRLSKDLIAVANRRRAELKTTDEQTKLKEIEEEIKSLEDKKQHVSQEKGSIRSKIDGLDTKERMLRDEFRREGGELLEQCDSIEAERKAVRHRLDDAEDKLRELAAGLAPLILVKNMIFEAYIQAEKEHEARLYETLKSVLEERDAELLKILKAAEANESVIQLAEEFFVGDIAIRDKVLDVQRNLNVEQTAFVGLASKDLQILNKNIEKQVEHTDKIVEQLSDLDRKLAAVPDPETLEGITGKLTKVRAERDNLRIKHAALENEYNSLVNQVMLKQEERLRHLERTADQRFIDQSTKRIFKHSEKVRQTLEKFRKAVANKHITQLEGLILESFQQLVHKHNLVHKLTIDPHTYQLTLYNAQGDVILPERLSAGERQLLAISILWGLGKASGRPLPSIIDTPLGRLDGIHRQHLVDHYFPYASHQVILLSTDEEIDEEYHQHLKKAIGREYQITYDEQMASSTISQGYFW